MWDELAERLDLRMHTHLAETEDENRYAWKSTNAGRSIIWRNAAG